MRLDSAKRTMSWTVRKYAAQSNSSIIANSLAKVSSTWEETPLGYRRFAPSLVRATSASWASHNHDEIHWGMRAEAHPAKMAALQKPRRLPESFRHITKNRSISSDDFRCRSAFDFKNPACVLQRLMLANACHDILQRTTFRHVIEHVVDRDQRHERGIGHILQSLQSAAIIAPIKQAASQPDGLARDASLRRTKRLTSGLALIRRAAEQ